MKNHCWTALTGLAAFLASGSLLPAADLYVDKEPAKAQPLVLPKPADVVTFTVHPEKVSLKGADDAAQLILTAALSGGKLQDLTGDVKYDVADAKVARVTSTGRVVPLANGSTEVTATYG